MKARYVRPVHDTFGPAASSSGPDAAGLGFGGGGRVVPKSSVHSEMARRYVSVAAFDTAMREGRIGSPALAIEIVAFSCNDEAPPHAGTVRRWWVRWRTGSRRFESLVARDLVRRPAPHPIIDEAVRHLCPDASLALPERVVAERIHAELVRASEFPGSRHRASRPSSGR